MTKEQFAKMMDHTLLSPVATKNQIEALCEEAKKNQFASVCVNPVWVKFCSEKLKNSSVLICTVVGFPLGAEKIEAKVFSAKMAVLDGADEIDMAINIAKVKEGDFLFAQNEIAQVVQAAKEQSDKKITIKAILETCYLKDEEIRCACIAAKNANADFVKTSTGFANPKDQQGNPLPNGACVHHIELMRKTVGTSMGVKASGGIRTFSFAQNLIKAGANRLGTSCSKEILRGFEN